MYSVENENCFQILPEDLNNTWDQRSAIKLCEIVESECMANGTCHVGLTGGTLYKSGVRKDCDIIFYKVRDKYKIDRFNLLNRLEKRGIKVVKRCGWVFKAEYQGKSIDMFFPECEEQWDEGERDSRYG